MYKKSDTHTHTAVLLMLQLLSDFLEVMVKPMVIYGGAGWLPEMDAEHALF